MCPSICLIPRRETSFTMDLAKMLAKIKLIESLHDDNFYSIREARTGLFSMPANLNRGRADWVINPAADADKTVDSTCRSIL